MESKHSLFKSFRFAFEGLEIAFIRGRNFRIQIAMGFLATVAGVILKLSMSEWLDLVLVISLVLILELVNTVIETILNIVNPEISDKVKIAKDVAAATVLLASIGSVIIGALLFIPKLLH
jgi:diacylglycerol kinase